MGTVVYAIASYAAFAVSILWTTAFLANVVLPGIPTTTIDGGHALPLPVALAVDVALIALFGVQHSVMARPAFKRGWTRLVPPPVERATYVLASALAMLALLALWEPVPVVVWSVTSSALRAAVWALYGAGWLIAITSTFLVDHFHLFGLKQALAGMKGQAAPEPAFRKVLFYRLVRHPLMVGFLVAFWSAPTMTIGHLLFSAGMTAYIFVGVHFEERDLRATIGPTYDEYRREVRMLLPVPRRKG